MLRGSGHNMGRIHVRAERASWFIADFFEGIHTTLRTRRNFAVLVELDVRRQVGGKVDGFTIGLAIFQGEFLGGNINLAKVVDAKDPLTRIMYPNKIWNRDSRYQYDTEANSHDPKNNFGLGRRFFLRFTHIIESTPRG